MSGAINYLVKPVTKIDLIKAIDLALRKISGREKDKTEVLKMASILQDREYSQMIQRREMPFVPSFSINNFADLAGMSLMLVKIHNFQGVVRTGGYDMNFLSYQIKQKIRELFEDDDLIVFNNIYRLNEFIAVSDKDETEMTRIAEKLRVRLSSLFKCRLTICTSQHSYSMDSIHMAYVEAVGLLMTRKYCSRDEIVLPDREKTSGQNASQCIPYGGDTHHGLELHHAIVEQFFEHVLRAENHLHECDEAEQRQVVAVSPYFRIKIRMAYGEHTPHAEYQIYYNDRCELPCDGTVPPVEILAVVDQCGHF